ERGHDELCGGRPQRRGALDEVVRLLRYPRPGERFRHRRGEVRRGVKGVQAFRHGADEGVSSHASTLSVAVRLVTSPVLRHPVHEREMCRDIGWTMSRHMMGWLTGLEPATPATTTRCSTN